MFFLLSFFIYSKDLLFFFKDGFYFNRAIALSASYYISQNMLIALKKDCVQRVFQLF